MPRPNRPHRQAPDIDDDYDDDLLDDGAAQQAGQEKMKILALDLLGRWHWIALGLVLGLLGGFYYLSKAPKIYQARSTLLIKQQATSVMSRDQNDDMDLRTLEALNTMADRITRPELLEKVAARPEVRALPGLMPQPVEWLPDWVRPWLGNTPPAASGAGAEPSPPPPPAALAGAIASWTKISVRRGTRLLDVLVSHPSPEAAQTIANAIGIEYRSELTGSRSSDRSSSLKILMEESNATRESLQKAQNAMAIYQRALVTLKELEVRETAFADLIRRYLPKHPKYIAASSELSAVQQRFLAEFDAARTSSADRTFWDEHAADWQKTSADPAARLLSARRLLLARGNVLESEISSQTNVFNSILTRIQESDINQQAVESEMEISSSARLPQMPVSPVPTKAIGMWTGGGLAFGVLLAMGFIRLDNKIHTVAQVERETGIPTLAAVAEIPLKALEAASRKHKPLPSLVIPAARKRWHPTLLFHEGTSTTTYAEMFRVLRASISLLGDEKKRRITLFSSALPGEGKTLVSSNFALAAAHQGKRTLLIDLDLRKPAVHKIFGLKRDSHPFGASEVLAGQIPFAEGILTDTGSANLDLMFAGKQAPNPGELLDAGTLEEFLKTALATYYLVVIDSAPLLAVPDTRIIVPLVDNFCLVVRADYVPKGAVRRTIAMMEHDRHPPCGIVFNGFSEKRRLIGQNYSYGNYQTNRYGKAYRYGYGSYGSYGTYGSDADK